MRDRTTRLRSKPQPPAASLRLMDTPRWPGGAPAPAPLFQTTLARPARRRAWLIAGLALIGPLPAAPRHAAAADLSALADPGTSLLLRHALTEPGIGDPPGFRLGDCATQRNLSDAGRAQARRAGERLRERAIPIDTVFSSRWCRCLETAQLAFGQVAPWPALDSFFDDASAGPARTASLISRVFAHRAPGLLVMVTHQVNITSATGLVPAMGEALAVRAGGKDTLRVVGRYRLA